METDTHTGFALKFKQNKIEFINDNQVGIFNQTFVYDNEFDFMQLMTIIRSTLELHKDLEEMKSTLEELVNMWLRSWGNKQEVEFDIEVSFEEKTHFIDKYATLYCNHRDGIYRSEIAFHITRLRKCQSLRKLATTTIAKSLKGKYVEIEDFEIPKTLKKDLNMAIRKWHKKWTNKQKVTKYKNKILKLKNKRIGK